MLLDLAGRPAPPSDIVRRLQQVDANLGLLWTPVGDDDRQGRWAVTMKWPPADRRYAYIQRGEVPSDSDFDVVVFLPADCSVDDAFGYFVNRVRSSSREDVKAMVNRVQDWNKTQTDRNWQPVMDTAMEEVQSLAHGLYSGGSTAKRRKRGK
jgi:hypothetical protein